MALAGILLGLIPLFMPLIDEGLSCLEISLLRVSITFVCVSFSLLLRKALGKQTKGKFWISRKSLWAFWGWGME